MHSGERKATAASLTSNTTYIFILIKKQNQKNMFEKKMSNSKLKKFKLKNKKFNLENLIIIFPVKLMQKIAIAKINNINKSC